MAGDGIEGVPMCCGGIEGLRCLWVVDKVRGHSNDNCSVFPALIGAGSIIVYLGDLIEVSLIWADLRD